jgi:hypothetical protein
VDDEGARDSWKPGESLPGPMQERLEREAASRRYERRIFGEMNRALRGEAGDRVVLTAEAGRRDGPH